MATSHFDDLRPGERFSHHEGDTEATKSGGFETRPYIFLRSLRLHYFFLRAAIVEGFRGPHKFSSRCPLPRNAHHQHPALLSCVILRSAATKNLLLIFLSWLKELGKAHSRCFTTFSMTRQQTPNAPKESYFLCDLCAFARDIPSFGCGPPRYGHSVLLSVFLVGPVGSPSGVTLRS